MSTKEQGGIAPAPVEKPDNAPEGGAEAGKEAPKVAEKPVMPPEIGGPKGPEPTRYGDWEQKGRVSDF